MEMEASLEDRWRLLESYWEPGTGMGLDGMTLCKWG